MRRPTDPERTLADIRARAREGLPLTRHAVRNTGLFDRARRDFGGWAEAMEAAGLEVRRWRGWRPPRNEAAPSLELSQELLEGELPTRTLARLTGKDRRTVRWRRQQLGAEAPHVNGVSPHGDALDALLERLPVTAVARRTGLPVGVVKARAKDLTSRRPPPRPQAIRTGPRPTRKSLEIAALRGVLTRLSKKELGSILRRLDRRAAVVARARILDDPPSTLAEVGNRLSVTRQRVGQLEAKVVPALWSAIRVTARRRSGRAR